MQKLNLFALPLLAIVMLTACKKEPYTEPYTEPLVLSLTFDVDDVTHNSASFDVVPSDKTIRYYWNVMSESNYNDLGSPEAVKERDMEGFRNQVTSEKPLDQVIADKLDIGHITQKLSGLRTQTRYVAYGYAISGTLTSDISVSAPFTTEELKGGNAPIDIEVNSIKMTGFDTVFTPDNINVLYMTDAIPADQFELFGGDDDAIVNIFEDKVAYSIEYWLSQDKIVDREILITQQWKRGVQDKSFSGLIPESNYIVYAVRLSEQYEVMDVKYKMVSTADLDVKDVTFDITVTDVEMTTATVSIVPSDKNQKYLYGIIEKAYFTQSSNDYVFMQRLINSYSGDISEILITGDMTTGIDSQALTGLTPNTDWLAVALVCENGTWNSRLFKAEFRTKPSLSADELEVNITIDDATSTAVAGFFDVNEPTLPLHYTYMKKSEADKYSTNAAKVQAGFDAYFKKWYDNMVANNVNVTMEDVINARAATAWQERYTYVEVTLEPNTDYYLISGVIDPTTAKLISKPFMGAFKTLPWVEGKGTITPECQYFRLLGASIVDPAWAGGPPVVPGNGDRCIVVYDNIAVTGAGTWYIGHFRNDRSDKNIYPDSYIASSLRQGGAADYAKDGPAGLISAFGVITQGAVILEETTGGGLPKTFSKPWIKVIELRDEICSAAADYPLSTRSASASQSSMWSLHPGNILFGGDGSNYGTADTATASVAEPTPHRRVMNFDDFAVAASDDDAAGMFIHNVSTEQLLDARRNSRIR